MTDKPPAPDLLAAAEALLSAGAVAGRFPEERRLQDALTVCVVRLRLAAMREEESRQGFSVYVEEMMEAAAKAARSAERSGPVQMGDLRRTLSDACHPGERPVDTIDKSLEIARRVKGRESYVDSWAVEKLWKVAQAIARARLVVVPALSSADTYEVLLEAWRNVLKLGAYMAGNTAAYDDAAAHDSFEHGPDMLDQLEGLLAPILGEG